MKTIQELFYSIELELKALKAKSEHPDSFPETLSEIYRKLEGINYQLPPSIQESEYLTQYREFDR